MAKGGGTQTVTQASDPATQAYTQRIRDAAQAAGGSPPPGLTPETQSAIDSFGQYMRGGNLGFGALNGDPNAIASFMNPYQNNVIDATKAQFANLRGDTMSSVNDAATQAGAFGGARHGVATGVALGELGRNEQSALADLYHSGFNESMGRAATSANLGFGASGALGSLGEYTRNVSLDQNPDLWRLKMLQAGMTQPTGSTQTTTGMPGHNPFSGFLGGAATGAGIGKFGGAWGTGIGAGIGGLLGLFG